MNTISVHQLKEILDRGEAIHLLDVRTPGEFSSAHIGVAQSIPLDSLDARQVQESCGDVPIYLICHAGTRARQAAGTLERAGITKTLVVDGGIRAWIKAGFPTEGTGRAVLPLDQQFQLTLGTLLLVGFLLAEFIDPRWIWLSGFIACGLLFAGSTGICLMRSLLAAMPWNQASSCSQRTCCVTETTEPSTTNRR
jgi:rhodanese-related sulfurtransferase